MDIEKNVLAIIPTGTGNGFSRSCNISRKWQAALKGLGKWEERLVDVGLVNGRYFVNVVGVGFDAAVEEMVSGKYKNIKGYLAYIIAFFDKLTIFKSFKTIISCDDQVFDSDNTLMVVTANGSYYGGKFGVAPQASIDDGKFDLCIINYISIPSATYMAVKALFKRHLTKEAVITTRGEKILVEAEEDVPVHVDGELTGQLPIEITMHKAALRMLAP